MKRALLLALLAALVLAGRPAPARAQYILVPMDQAQSNHLKAYGLTFWVLSHGQTAEWVLNYRAGSFLLPDRADVRREAALRGVSFEPQTISQVAQLRESVAQNNMDIVILEKAPKIAVYTPKEVHPWDDAVTLALAYADIPYDKVYDTDVLEGRLRNYDWLHLHHEDFTGQYSKFYINYAGAPWLQDEVRADQAEAKQFGYATVPDLKKAVAERIREYVANGGFLFAMCTATETLDLAVAGLNVNFAQPFASGGVAPDPNDSKTMDWSKSLAFQNAQIQNNPSVNAFSDIDGHQVNTPWRQPLGAFALFDFSAKFDPVPAMLVQDHEQVIPDFYGLTTSFRRDRIKSGVIVLAQEEGTPWAKYIHGDYGKGTWTFLGGHDPEDPQHQVGAAPTDLSQHPHSPGYRLILNNVLFPAAKKKTLKT
ncbi:MAG TPA: hypothetical protein VF832_14595 [Longimicrobiales bacterium]